MHVLEQMLSVLDCLSCNDMCHRDVKPENILWYSTESGDYTFQLADFGLANYGRFAMIKCGTGYYETIELHPEYGRFAQSPKMDVRPLSATVIDTHPSFSFPPVQARTYDEVL
jgi:serine/threonine protein kinase